MSKDLLTILWLIFSADDEKGPRKTKKSKATGEPYEQTRALYRYSCVHTAIECTTLSFIVFKNQKLNL